MDNITGNENIANIFSEKFERLYNSVGYKNEDMLEITKTVDHLIDNDNCKSSHIITIENILKAVDKLKTGKSEANGIFSDHILQGPRRLHIILLLLLNSMLSHGVAPPEMLTGTMIPLQKDKRGLRNNSENYRAITLGSIIGKLYDIVVLQNQACVFETSSLQFGFKENSSTTLCTFSVKETISYYISNKSSIYSLMLDASKAFDRVNYCKLFKKLIERKMCPMFIRLLIHMYTNQNL